MQEALEALRAFPDEFSVADFDNGDNEDGAEVTRVHPRHRLPTLQGTAGTTCPKLLPGCADANGCCAAFRNFSLASAEAAMATATTALAGAPGKGKKAPEPEARRDARMAPESPKPPPPS